MITNLDPDKESIDDSIKVVSIAKHHYSRAQIRNGTQKLKTPLSPRKLRKLTDVTDNKYFVTVRGKKGKNKTKYFNLPNRKKKEVEDETDAIEKGRKRANLEAARLRQQQQEEERARKAFSNLTFEEYTENERKKKRRERDLMDKASELREQLKERDGLLSELRKRVDNTKRKTRSRGNSSTVTPGTHAEPTRGNVNVNLTELEARSDS